MSLIHAWMVAAAPLLLLAAGLIPNRWANGHIRVMRHVALLAGTGSLVLSVVASILLGRYGPVDEALAEIARPLPLNVGVYFDSLSAVMLLLISFIGLIIARYSMRYLDGEATRDASCAGWLLRWGPPDPGDVLQTRDVHGRLDVDQLRLASAADLLSGASLGGLGGPQKVSHQPVG